MPIKFKIVKKVTEDPYVLQLNEPIDGTTQLRWEPLPHDDVKVVLPSTVPSYSEPQEVWDLVREWYASRGQPVPPEEEKACLDAIHNGWPIPPPEKVVEYESVTPAKPAYGTPEFWKAYWIKKKAAMAAGGETAPKKESKKKVSPP